ncbi:MAG: hypothetical protein ACRDPW_04220 [Mycobacteriales bacterium]
MPTDHHRCAVVNLSLPVRSGWVTGCRQVSERNSSRTRSPWVSPCFTPNQPPSRSNAAARTVTEAITLSPQATLDRGYAIVQREGGAGARQPAELTVGELVRLRLAGGERGARIQ